MSAVSEDKEDIFLGTMEAGENAWMVDLKFRNTKVNLKIENGADVTVVSEQYAI